MKKVTINKRFVEGNLQGLKYETEILMGQNEIEDVKQYIKDGYVFRGLGSPYVIESIVVGD